MRWEGRRQSNNVEDRRGMRVSRGGLVGGGLGTIAIALLVMFLGGDPTPILQGAGNAPVQTTTEPYVESPEERRPGAISSPRCSPRRKISGPSSLPPWAGHTRNPRWSCSARPWRPAAASPIPAWARFIARPTRASSST